MNYPLSAYIACAVLVLQNCLTFLVIRWSRTEGGKSGEEVYLTSWVVVLSEVGKILLSFALSIWEIRSQEPQQSADAEKGEPGDLHLLSSSSSSSPSSSSSSFWSSIETATSQTKQVWSKVFSRSLLPVSVPGLLYCLQNNLLFYALSHLDAVLFSLTSQFKIITTAVFSVLILKRKLSTMQWVSLVLLMTGICFVQYDSFHTSAQQKEQLQQIIPPQSPDLSSSSSSSSSSSPTSSHHLHHSPPPPIPSPDDKEEDLSPSKHGKHPIVGAPETETEDKETHDGAKQKSLVKGLTACFALTLTSAAAGVYFEKVLKGLTGRPTSTWISNIQLALFGSIGGFFVLYSRDWEQFSSHSWFHGFTPVVWFAVFLHTTGGIIVALVVKYADNILKSFATSFSLILTSLVSYFLGIPLSFFFVLGVIQVIIASHLYTNSPPT